MTERITRAHLDVRIESLNARMERCKSRYRYGLIHSSGRFMLDRFRVRPNEGHIHISTVTTGTKSEIAHSIYAMCTALDDSREMVENG